jgi:hypothetical protein
VYPSKVDWWLAAILLIAPLVPTALGIYMCAAFGWWGLFAIFIGLFMAAVMAVLTIPCRYRITDSAVEVKCGMIEERIEFRSILGIERSSNATSAPALSLERVKIRTSRGPHLISPVRRDEFIAELNRRCKEAAIRGAATTCSCELPESTSNVVPNVVATTSP